MVTRGHLRRSGGYKTPQLALGCIPVIHSSNKDILNGWDELTAQLLFSLMIRSSCAP